MDGDETEGGRRSGFDRTVAFIKRLVGDDEQDAGGTVDPQVAAVIERDVPTAPARDLEELRTRRDRAPLPSLERALLEERIAALGGDVEGGDVSRPVTAAGSDPTGAAGTGGDVRPWDAGTPRDDDPDRGPRAEAGEGPRTGETGDAAGTRADAGATEGGAPGSGGVGGAVPPVGGDTPDEAGTAAPADRP